VPPVLLPYIGEEEREEGRPAVFPRLSSRIARNFGLSLSLWPFLTKF